MPFIPSASGFNVVADQWIYFFATCRATDGLNLVANGAVVF